MRKLTGIVLTLLLANDSTAHAQPAVILGPANVSVVMEGPADHPYLSGDTDMRNGAQVVVLMAKARQPDARRREAAGFPPCDGGCGMVATKGGFVPGMAFVSNGRWRVGPFSAAHGRALDPGLYQVTITFLPPLNVTGDDFGDQDEILRQVEFKTVVGVGVVTPPPWR